MKKKNEKKILELSRHMDHISKGNFSDLFNFLT